MPKNKKVVVLLSGGMDSTTALYHARQVWSIAAALSFDYGSKHNAKELPCAAYHCRKLEAQHETIVMDFIDRLFVSDLLNSGGEIPDGHYADETMRRTVVPFRNGIMLAIAAGYAESLGAEGLVIAAHAGDHAVYPDCRAEFMDSMERSIKLGTYAGIELLRPFISMNKGEIAALGRRLGVDYSRTWSCYKGGAIHCGTCGTCVERREAFRLANIPDPTDYQSADPWPFNPT